MVVVPRGGTRGGGATSTGVGAGASASGTRCAAGGRCAHSAGRRVQRASAVRKSWVRASASGWRRGAVVGRNCGPSAPSAWRLITTTRRSEEHTSELQSRLHLVCRLLLEKK